MHVQAIMLSASLVILVGCATPDVVDVRQVGDKKLSCEELKEQIEDAKRFEKKARDEKGVTGTNVAAAVFFWPGLLATYANVDEAIDAAQERERHLTKIYEKKGCD